MKKEISQIKMSTIVGIQMMGKKRNSPYAFENLAKLSDDELQFIQDMEVRLYNEFITENKKG